MNNSLDLTEDEIDYFQELVSIRFPILELSLKKDLENSNIHKLVLKDTESLDIVSCTKTPTCIQVLDKFDIHWYIEFVNEVIGPVLFKVSYLLARRLVSLRATKFLERLDVEITDIKTLNKMALNIEHTLREILKRVIHSKLEHQLHSKKKEAQTRESFLDVIEKTIFTDVLQNGPSIVIVPMFIEVEGEGGWGMLYVDPTIEMESSASLCLH